MKILIVTILILLSIILVVLLYFLLNPIKLIVDSQNKLWIMKWTRFISAFVTDENGKWGVQLRAPFWSKYFSVKDMIQNQKKKKEKGVDKKVTKSNTSKSKWNLKRLRRIFKQIKIRELKLSIDTSDVIYNAYLTPIFHLLRYKTGYYTAINYLGINKIKLKAESRMINLLIAGFKK